MINYHKKWVALIIGFFSYAAFAAENTPFSLDKRPGEIQRVIDQEFKKISSKLEGGWLYNGESYYDFEALNEYAIAKATILDEHSKNPEKEEFYVLDVGAGNFFFGKTLASYFNQSQELLDKKIKIKIISVRGEQNQDENSKVEGICTHYMLGGVKVEIIQDYLQENGFSDIKFSFAVSSWCLRHLTDPLGTVQQIMSLLEDQGTFLFDGFDFKYDHEDLSERTSINNVQNKLMELMLASKTLFLMTPSNEGKKMSSFLLRKDSQLYEFVKLTYDRLVRFEASAGCGQYVTSFKRTQLDNASLKILFSILKEDNPNTLIGSKVLYEWVNQAQAFFLVNEQASKKLTKFSIDKNPFFLQAHSQEDITKISDYIEEVKSGYLK